MNLFDIFPKPSKDDPFRIRRFFAYAVLTYCLLFPLLVLGVYVYKGMDAATVTAFLGIIGALTAFIAKMYFEAVK